MIDLHIHSTYSDGTDNVIDILKKAEELKLEAISITDHESCDAYFELEKIDVKKYFSGKIIKGIELKTQFNDRVIDILGYNIDHNIMKKYLDECYKNVTRENIQEKKLQEFYNYGKEYDLTLRPINDLVWNKKKDWASIVFYNELKAHEENKSKVPEDLWNSFDVFKQDYYNIKGKMFYVNIAKDYPSFDEIMKMIHNSGGIAFAAHIYIYKWMDDKLDNLKLMADSKIDGIECYHNTFTDENIKTLLKFCNENKLLVSGGTDYHGKNKPNVKLGFGRGNLNIPVYITENWK